MKGLIPAAGMGKRLEPITHAIPKELLMVGDKAIIEYVIDSMKQVSWLRGASWCKYFICCSG